MIANVDVLKKLAAEKAVEEVIDNMIIGLGTGSTIKFAVLKLSERIKKGELRNVVCVSSSLETENFAKQHSIPLISFNEIYIGNENNTNLLSIYIDGADEVDDDNNLIKGGGGALLHEKILAQASKKFIVVVDETKLSKKIGGKFDLPVEVFPFSLKSEINFFDSINLTAKHRFKVSNPFITDEGNYIIDVKTNEIENPRQISMLLNERAGIVNHGIFLNDLVEKIIIAQNDGSISIRNVKST